MARESHGATLDKAPDAFRTISEVADDLDIPQHVLRFWETRFAQIKPMKRGGGRRYYRPDDVDLLRGIRFLLYGDGYTIRGVQRILKEQGVRFVAAIWRNGGPEPARPRGDGDEAERADVRMPGEGRSRLFGLLPRFGETEDEPAREEPTMEPVRPASVEPPPRRPVAPPERPAVAPAPQSDSAHRAGVRDSIPAAAAASTAAPGLGRDDLRKLQATLYELAECRRLIDAALREDA